MTDEESTIQKIKGPGFYVAVAIYIVVLLVLPTRDEGIKLLTLWFEDPDIHVIHNIDGAGFLWAVSIGIVAQLYKPERRRTALFASVFGWTVVLLVLVADMSPITFLPGIFLALTLLVVAFHPSGRSILELRYNRGFNLVLLVLVLIAAAPLVVYTADHIMLQINSTDSHAAEGHYALMTAMAALILVLGLIASVAEVGWRIPAWLSGGLAFVLGLSSVVYPDHPSSLGEIGGVLAIAWGIAFIVVAETSRIEGSPTVLRRRIGGGTD